MTDVPKILIVDDEQSICYVLKVNLELEGFSVDTAFSAEEALAKRLERYDLFLLDVMMEHMSGFDLAKVIRGREELNAIPIIFCTAKDSEDDLLEGFKQFVQIFLFDTVSRILDLCMNHDGIFIYGCM